MKVPRHKPANWILLVVLMLSGSGFQTPSTPVPEFPKRLLAGDPYFHIALLFQGDLRGHYAPTGDPGYVMGGFARRMSYFNAMAAEYPTRHVMRLDGGSIFSIGAAGSSIINRWILEGTSRCHLDAINLSAWDAPVWQQMEALAAAGGLPKELLNVPLVSANVTGSTANYPSIQRFIVREYVIESQRGRKVRVGVTGLLEDPDERVAHAGLLVEEPVAAARKIVEEMARQTDYRIVLTDMDLGKAISLAINVPKIDLILVSHDYQDASETQQVGETLVVTSATDARMVSEIRMIFDFDNGRADVQSRIVPLDKSIPDDPTMADLVRSVEAEVREAVKPGR